MSIFDSIKHAIFGHEPTAAAAAPVTAPAPAPAPAAAAPNAKVAASTGVPAAPAAATAISVETLQARLTALGAKNSQQLKWQTSIVDLLKLVGLDSSYDNRKQLAHELGYTGDTGDSASMNIWLHKEVMERLAQAGGNVPGELK